MASPFSVGPGLSIRPEFIEEMRGATVMTGGQAKLAAKLPKTMGKFEKLSRRPHFAEGNSVFPGRKTARTDPALRVHEQEFAGGMAVVDRDLPTERQGLDPVEISRTAANPQAAAGHSLLQAGKFGGESPHLLRQHMIRREEFGALVAAQRIKREFVKTPIGHRLSKTRQRPRCYLASAPC